MVSRMINIGEIPATAGGIPVAVATIPAKADLLAAHLLGGGVDLARRNWGSAGGSVMVGVPAAAAGYLTLSGAAYIQTAVRQTAEMTIIATLRRSAGSVGNIGIVGDFESASRDGICMWAASTVAARVPRSGGTSNFGGIGAVNNWSGYALVARSAPVDSIHRLSTGQVVDSPNTGSRVVAGAGAIRIGCTYNTSWVAPVDLNAVLIYGRALSPSELASVAIWQAQYAGQFGMVL